MKRIKSYLAVLLALVLLVGCGAPANTAGSPTVTPSATSTGVASETPTNASKEPIEVIWWSNFSGTMAETLATMIQKYNYVQDKYVVKFEFQGGASDLMAKLQASSQKELPDMFSGAVEHTGFFAASEFTKPLQDFIDADKWDYSTTYPHLKSAYSDGEGNQIGYPIGNSFAGVYVNMDIFKAAGIDPYKEIKSLQDVYEISKKLVDGGYCEYGVAFHPNGYYVNAALAVEGVDSVDAGNGYNGKATASLYDTSPTKDALYSMLDAYQKIYAGGYGVPYGTDCNAEVVPMFATGKLAMFVGVISFHNRILKAGGDKVDIGMLTMPGCSDNSRSTGVPAGGTGSFICNNGKTESQQGAYDFIKWMAEPENAAYWSTSTGYLPVSSDAAETDTYKAFVEKVFPRAAYCLDAQKNGDSNTKTPYLPIANEVLKANLLAVEQVCNDPKYSIDQAIKDANATIAEALELYNLAN